MVQLKIRDHERVLNALNRIIREISYQQNGKRLQKRQTHFTVFCFLFTRAQFLLNQ